MANTPNTAPLPPVPPPPVAYQRVPRVRRRSVAGPVVLIIVGVVFLLANVRVITWHTMGLWFARYWPVLIIVWGLIKLAEYYRAKQEGQQPAGIGAGGVVLLIFLIACGLAATKASRLNWEAIGAHIEVNDDTPFAGLWGTPYTFTEQADYAFPAGSSLRVICERGDVTVLATDETKVKVTVRKRVLADSQDEANRMHDSTKPGFTTTGTLVTLSANAAGAESGRVRSDLEIYVPRAAAVEIATGRGKVKVQDRVGNVKLSTTHGAVEAINIEGNLDATLRGGSFRAEKISGDVNVGESMDEASVSNVGGSVRLSGSFDSIRLAAIGKGVSFQSPRTDLQFGQLEGELMMEGGEMRAKSLAGPFRITTRSKDIHLDDLSGEVRINNRNAEIEVRAGKLPLGNMEINNDNGRIVVYVPPQANFSLDARTVRGEIESEFSELNVQSGHRESRATGSVGAGGAQLRLKTEHGDIEIRKTG